jgi:hypothetical protein
MDRHKTGRRDANAARSQWKHNVDRRHVKLQPGNRRVVIVKSQLVPARDQLLTAVLPISACI